MWIDEREGKNMLKAKYTGKLPIGNVNLDCAVLDDNSRVLTASSVFTAFHRSRKGRNDRLEIEGTKLPPFIAAKNLEPYISSDFLARTNLITYLDGTQEKTGYLASILPAICNVYLAARRDNVLVNSQQKIALQAEILLTAFASVGIDALVDEATGFQYERRHDALKVLLAQYLADGMQRWILTFPDSFFAALDHLYRNNPTTAKMRPQYYGKFINKYVYNPIENGYVKKELDKLNIDPVTKQRKARFHQWLSENGRNVLMLQIGKVLSLMEVSNSIDEFKSLAKRQKLNSLMPNLFENIDELL